MSVQWYLASLLDGVNQAIKPLADALDSPEAFGEFLASFGYESAATQIQQVETAFAQVKQAYDALLEAAEHVEELRADEDPELGDLVPLIKDLTVATAGVLKAIEQLQAMGGGAGLPHPLNEPAFWQEFPPELFETLLHRYLEVEQPKLFALLMLFGVLSVENVEPQAAPGIRDAYRRRQVNWDRIGLLVGQPDRLMTDVYGFGQTFQHRRLIANLTILANAFGLPAAETELADAILTNYYGGTPQPGIRQLLAPLYWDAVETPGGFGYASLQLIVAPIPPGAASSTPSGFTFFPVLAGRGGQAIDIAPSVTATIAGGFESAGPIRLEVQPDAVEVVVPPALGVEIAASARIEVAANAPLILFGAKESTRLEVENLKVELSVRGPLTDLEYRFGLGMEAVRLIVFLAEGDGFLQQAMPKDPLRIELGFGLDWSSKTGLVFGASASFEATFPIHLDLFGVLKIDSVYLALQAKTGAPATVELVAATSASLTLGPVLASVERIGMSGRLTFPEGGGNLGPGNLTFGFKPPRGVGFVIDASAVVGGGYLFFDPDHGQYGGVLQLEVKGGISIKAIALISTIMPDGSPGFSLLIIIAVEFSPIQLGYGFTLNGVGGLAGLNRTMKTDALRDGIKNRTLDSIMFPPDPIANAQKIISDLQAVFPPALDRFVFAPMVKLGWGAGMLLIEIGLAVELPWPLRLAIMGKLHVLLPPIQGGEGEENPTIVELHLDVLGILDFDKNEVSVDAVLYHSRIVVFPITGGMALRVRWGSNPVFLMAIGGLNPRFAPPPKFPIVDRLGLNLSYDSNGLKACLRLETYLAVTPNSLQFGARIEAYAELSVAKVAGLIGFDALIEFSPFHFIVDLYGGVTVEAFGFRFNVKLLLTLSGPSPFLGEGRVSVEFLGAHEFPIRFVVGEEDTTPALPPVDPLPELLAAIADRRNWSATLPGGGSMLVTIRQLTAAEAGDRVLAHPLGELTVRQKVLPFGITLERFGAAVAATPGPFEIAQVKIGSKPEAPPDLQLAVRDAFARGQFVNLTEDEKVTGPVFEPFRCGQSRLGTDAIVFPSGAKQAAGAEYDVTVIDEKETRIRRPVGTIAMSNDIVLRGAQFGAARQTPMTATGSAKFAGPALGITVQDPAYAVAERDQLEGGPAAPFETYTEAEADRRRRGGDRQVVEAYEVA